MRSYLADWQFWAILAAMFAALTAIFGKVGVEKVDPNFATLIRTVVILVFISGLVLATRTYQPMGTIPARTYLFLVLSGVATGASWICYYTALKLGPASRVAPVDKLSVVFVAILSVLFLGERLAPKDWFAVSLIAGGTILLAMKR
ncbi:EamA family transporter [Parvularcula marina]|uniref:EamA family transporter n=1 Tax=Parvularcula marina TaxID=2292771 RepID=UPI0035150C43